MVPAERDAAGQRRRQQQSSQAPFTGDVTLAEALECLVRRWGFRQGCSYAITLTQILEEIP